MHLTPEAEPVMESVRTSASNNRMVIYGLGGSAQEAMKFSKYGVNAVFHEPLERQAALKLVRATQMLVLHEFRRYVRIPIITEIAMVTADGRRFTATSKEISTGGMSVKSPEDVSIGMESEVSFALLTLPRIWVRATGQLAQARQDFWSSLRHQRRSPLAHQGVDRSVSGKLRQTRTRPVGLTSICVLSAKRVLHVLRYAKPSPRSSRFTHGTPGHIRRNARGSHRSLTVLGNLCPCM